MDYEHAERLLGILIDNANRIAIAGFGADQLEATFFQIVDLLRAQPELKANFIARIEEFMSVSDDGVLVPSLPSRELIELVAHELRWVEVLRCGEMRIERRFSGDRTLAIGDIATTVAEAFDDNWADREFYPRYGE